MRAKLTSLRSRWDSGWQVEIENSQVARGVVHSLDEAATWFPAEDLAVRERTLAVVKQMLVHFPDSLYAQTARGEIRHAALDNTIVRQLNGT